MSKQESQMTSCISISETSYGDNSYDDIGNKSECILTASPTISSSSSSSTTTNNSSKVQILKAQNDSPQFNTNNTNNNSVISNQLVQSSNLSTSSSILNKNNTICKTNELSNDSPSEKYTDGTSLMKVENTTIDTTIDSKLSSSDDNINTSTSNRPNTDRNNCYTKNGNVTANTFNDDLHNINKSKNENNQVKITLLDEKLWEKFHAFVNEMIVTKDGRRMFPVLKIKIEGLDPSSMYTVTMDFSVSDSHRWKFMNGRWIRGNKEDNIKNSNTYMHCDSPNFGSFWMNNTISFAKLKISNKVSKDSSKIQIHSLFRYLPRIHIYSIDSTTRGLTHVVTKHFECTEFVAVTAYQNDAITRLKVSYNPFAKAFLDVKRSGNDSPISGYNSGNHCHNRDIYKPYDNHSYKSFSSISSNTSSSGLNNNANNSYHKQLSTINEDNYSNLTSNSNQGSFFYPQNITNETHATNTNPNIINQQRHPRHACTTNSNNNTNMNSSSNPSSSSITNNGNVISSTNLPHYCDYLHSNNDNSMALATNTANRINIDSRSNTMMSFYDNSSNFKPPNYPYAYQYNCPNNYYYEKPYISTENGAYFYTKNDNTNNQSLNQSHNNSTNSNNHTGTNNNRNVNGQNIHQFDANFNYQNIALYKDVKDIKFHEKSTTIKPNHSSQTIREDKRMMEP